MFRINKCWDIKLYKFNEKKRREHNLKWKQVRMNAIYQSSAHFAHEIQLKSKRSNANGKCEKVILKRIPFETFEQTSTSINVYVRRVPRHGSVEPASIN